MSLVRARRRKDALKLQAGNDILVAVIAVLGPQVWVGKLKAGRQDNGTHIQAKLRFSHVMDHCLGQAGVNTLEALAADSAAETATGFCHGLFLG